MGSVLNLYQTKKRRALLSREAARVMAPTVRACLSEGNGGPSLTIKEVDPDHWRISQA